ncbi:MAG: hypothetical protein ACKOOF_11460, partial [Planctomycetaceae bacterium]
MPRRPPKKPDPALDLSGHLLVPDALPTPCDPASLGAAPATRDRGSSHAPRQDSGRGTARGRAPWRRRRRS